MASPRTPHPPTRPKPPRGRFFHSCFVEGTASYSHHAPSTDMVVFGGQQLQHTLGYTDSLRARLSCSAETPRRGDAAGEQQRTGGLWTVEWQAMQHVRTTPEHVRNRRGSTTFAIGRRLVVFGGSTPQRVGDSDDDGESGSDTYSQSGINGRAICRQFLTSRSHTAAEWPPPHATCCIAVAASAMRCGAARFSTSPTPSWPSRFHPQLNNPPALVSAIEWPKPHATPWTTSDARPSTRRGAAPQWMATRG